MLESTASLAMTCGVVRLQGVSELPPPEKIEKTVAKQHDFNRKNFTQVERHALMVRAICLCIAEHAA